MSPAKRRLLQRGAIEFTGTASLMAAATVAAVLPERLAALGHDTPGAVAIALSLLLFGLVILFPPTSRYAFNPALMLFLNLRGRVPLTLAVLCAFAQICGAFAGASAAQALLNLDTVQAVRERAADPLMFAIDVLAAFGFCATALIFSRRPLSSALASSAVIGLSVWISGGLAAGNPALSLAQSLTANFLALTPLQAFLAAVASLSGAVAAWSVMAALPRRPSIAP